MKAARSAVQRCSWVEQGTRLASAPRLPASPCSREPCSTVGAWMNPQPMTPSPEKDTPWAAEIGPRPKARNVASELPSSSIRTGPSVPAATIGTLGPVPWPTYLMGPFAIEGLMVA